MANLVLKGVYTTKTALDTAELATAENGDSYLVGTKCPYDVYTYSSSKTAFQKGDEVGRVGDLSVTIDDVNQDVDISKMYSITFKDGSKSYKIRQVTGRTLRSELYELFGV